ncbi:hypothetical protein PKNA1_C2_API05500 [Plasmodium knowlesi strain H]|uniref:Uncharacterized protein n=3 Tax=Plasmodium knowlesi TaxID=5850 RepID=A0A5E7XAP6_PLAKH|nr:hypothetical protein I6V24_pgp02 [Plasmodium knowlesi strain H]BBB58098.1 hypothetical protein [Plasmodium knowlesi]CAA9991358.1 hypothetical protein PKNH_API05500 [Plasmodium knowlesi strain H]SBO27226.1 hypothetical protein PKNA1_C2_API05500 [Plasmodium knowlesi strain H]VVS80832.1 hypothetical protein PKNH_API05500 [Plasmodium knowlesi strain H]
MKYYTNKYLINLRYYLNKYKKLIKYNKLNYKKINIIYTQYKKYILIIKKLRYLNII